MRGYYYEDPNFKLMSVNLNEEHLVALGFVETFLEEFKFMPIFNEFSDAVDKVLDGLEITKRFNSDYRSVNKFIQIDKSPYYKGKDTLSDLIKIISDQDICQIEYQKFGADTSKAYTIHPYLLKEFKNLWYLIGYVEEYQQVRTFAIDRVTNYKAIKERYDFIPPEDINFNADNFFKYCYGITTLSGQPEKVVLSFTPIQGQYIKTQPIHSSMKIIEDNEQACVVELQLVNNFELRNWILGFGSSVKVIEPQALKDSIREQLMEAANLYA